MRESLAAAAARVLPPYTGVTMKRSKGKSISSNIFGGTGTRILLACLVITVIWWAIPGEADAQVPSRVQTGQIVLPQPTAPPEQPLQMRLRELRGETSELERQVGILLPEKHRRFPPAIGDRIYVPPSGGGIPYVPPSGGDIPYVPPSQTRDTSATPSPSGSSAYVPPSGSKRRSLPAEVTRPIQTR